VNGWIDDNGRSDEEVGGISEPVGPTFNCTGGIRGPVTPTF
jgi:hypothetical protein